VSLRAERSNLIHNKIKHFKIAASLILVAMTLRIEFFRKLLEDSLSIRIKTETTVANAGKKEGASPKNG
jgi:hypothetical protein